MDSLIAQSFPRSPQHLLTPGDRSRGLAKLILR
ncbi:MAG: hypothetical protein RIS76_3504, partial [Verrucomicrobiota bacterium]